MILAKLVCNLQTTKHILLSNNYRSGIVLLTIDALSKQLLQMLRGDEMLPDFRREEISLTKLYSVVRELLF